MKHAAPFTLGEFYLIFNRANSPQYKLFYQEKNYAYFLKKWHYYLGDLFEILSYCLIPNHFHFLVRVKNGNNEEIIEKIRRFSISYTQAIKNRRIEEEAFFRNTRSVFLSPGKRIFSG